MKSWARIVSFSHSLKITENLVSHLRIVYQNLESKNSIKSNPDNISSEELQDVKAYEELSRQLFLELVDLNNTKERIRESKTLKGRYFNFLGYFFSLYCAYKIIMCTGKDLKFCLFFSINFSEHYIRSCGQKGPNNECGRNH